MMTQTPAPGSYILMWAGEEIEVTLKLNSPRKGRAALRTNIGNASIRRRETILETERGETPLARAWRDIPMEERAPGFFAVRVPLDEVGVFSAKACFFPEGSDSPEWPEGVNFHIKTAPARTARSNSIYTVFPRQFGPAISADPRTPEVREREQALDAAGYTVIPPSGTYRDVARRLDHIIGTLGFRIVQLLPVHPVPTTFARMGRFGSAFAATDFLAADPACAEFDTSATPLDQFRELADAVHARGGSLFIDLPANHTGWASALQTHHPEWFRRNPDGSFASPGAWGVVWADLVELDYRSAGLRAYMADVFLFWCRNGADGFRCDAGYMIPAETWTYIVARVREEYPDTVFMLEGLGGKVETTETLISESGLDWAYSELFQTEDRGAFEWYLPRAIAMSERCGPLVHFAETHDNNRLARKGKIYARMRTALSALLSHQGAWGIANGVEWYAQDKIDVHGASSLSWGAADNMCALVARLNRLLAVHPAFGPHTKLEMAQCGGGNFIAVKRSLENGSSPLLAVVNLDCENGTFAQWREEAFPAKRAFDLLGGRAFDLSSGSGITLGPGEFACLCPAPLDIDSPAAAALSPPPARDPSAPRPGEHIVEWRYPEDTRRTLAVPFGAAVEVRAPVPFRAELKDGARTVSAASSAPSPDGGFRAYLRASSPEREALESATGPLPRMLAASFYVPDGARRTSSPVLMLPPGENVLARVAVDAAALRCDPSLKTVLSNGAGADAQVPVFWGALFSQYDSLFSANPDPDVPSDRLVLWSRCRAWLQHEGYSREINGHCLSQFRADPAGRSAAWRFLVPCGMGRRAAFQFHLSLEEGANAVRLVVKRFDSGPLDIDSPVRIVFRPDVEWRSFHSCTKAFAGPEALFPKAVSAQSRGFRFAPEGGEGFSLSASRGEFHLEPEWSYCVGHPEEAERGQEPSGDLFSPGWFSCDFAPGAECVLRGSLDGAKGAAAVPPDPAKDAALPGRIPLDALAERAMDLFVVKRDDLKTVIAGYPWFLDWGRDTLIFLRGMIAAGRREESLEILRAFARFEERGTIPNIIHGSTVGNRDTSDAPLWLVAAAADLCAASPRGAKKILSSDCGGRTLLQVLDSVADNYMSGTPNGIRMDPESGLVFSPPHFTWMDTNYPAGTPRMGYPVEIQALWIHALRFLGRATGDASRAALADRAASSLARLFRIPGKGLADCLRAPGGVPAERAALEDAVRPNQLLAVAFGDVLDPRSRIADEIIAATARLVVPGAARTLDDAPTGCDFPVRAADGRLLNDPHRPYAGRYTGDEDTMRKPAYHNGTAWPLCFPVFAEALAMRGGTPAARETALSLLASAGALFDSGCICHLPEIADGDSPHAQKGCRAQAWSVSEFYRVWRLLSPAAKGGKRKCRASSHS